MKDRDRKSKERIIILVIVGIVLIAGTITAIYLSGNKEPPYYEISIEEIGTEDGADLGLPYEYIQSILNRQDSLLEHATDIEAQTYIVNRPDDIAMGFMKPWYVGPFDKLSYIQGITGTKTIERKKNGVVTFIDGFDDSYMMKKASSGSVGYAILPEWMAQGLVSGHRKDDLSILLLNKEPEHIRRDFKVIGFYKADSADTVYVSINKYAELYQHDKQFLESFIKSLSIYYEEDADTDSINSFLNGYFSESDAKKEGENWIYRDYDYYYRYSKTQ